MELLDSWVELAHDNVEGIVVSLIYVLWVVETEDLLLQQLTELVEHDEVEGGHEFVMGVGIVLHDDVVLPYREILDDEVSMVMLVLQICDEVEVVLDEVDMTELIIVELIA